MPPADLAVLGAAIRTLDPARPHATAVAVRDGLIVAVGDDAEVRALAGAGDRARRRARDRARARARRQPHPPVPRHRRHARRRPQRPAHARRGARRARGRAGALRAGRVAARLGPLLRRVRRRADRAPTRSPTRPATRPAYLTFFDYHSALASRPALALAGVDGAARVRRRLRGRVRRRAASRPASCARRRRWSWWRRSCPERTRAERLDAYAETLRRLNALGLTGGARDARLAVAARRRRGARGARRPDAALRACPLLMEPDVTDEELEALLALRDRGGAALARRRGEVLHRRRDRHRAPRGCSSPVRTARAPSRSGPIPTATPRSSRAARAPASSARRTRSATARSPRRSTPTATPAPRPIAPHRIEHLETLRDAELARLRRGGRRRLDAAAARRGPRRARAVQLARPAPARAGRRRLPLGATCGAAARSSRSARTGRS